MKWLTRLRKRPSPSKGWFTEYYDEKMRADRAEAMLKSIYRGDHLRRAEHIRLLGEKIHKLRREVRYMQECAESHNAESYATGLIVRCTGCEAGAPFKPENLTEEKVVAVEIIAHRLRAWWNGHNYRLRIKKVK